MHRANQLSMPLRRIVKHVICMVNELPVLILSNGIERVEVSRVAELMNVGASQCRMVLTKDKRTRVFELQHVISHHITWHLNTMLFCFWCTDCSRYTPFFTALLLPSTHSPCTCKWNALRHGTVAIDSGYHVIMKMQVTEFMKLMTSQKIIVGRVKNRMIGYWYCHNL